MLDPAIFKQALSRFPAGVTIVTTTDGEGERWGFTASSFSSLSLDPPLVLVCLAEDADCAPAFREAKGFNVNILGTADTAAAWTFADRGADKFAGVAMEDGDNGHPVLPSAVAVLECSLEVRHPGGDHTILVGRVDHARATDEPALVFADRGFHRLTRMDD